MSTIKADTIVAADGSSPVTLTKQSAAKAWNNVNGTGTIASRDSFNISSISDTGTGDITHSFTNSMDSTDNFVASGWARVSGSWGYFVGNNNSPMTASSFRHGTLGSGDTSYDALFATVSIDGDLA